MRGYNTLFSCINLICSKKKKNFFFHSHNSNIHVIVMLINERLCAQTLLSNKTHTHTEASKKKRKLNGDLSEIGLKIH